MDVKDQGSYSHGNVVTLHCIHSGTSVSACLLRGDAV